ncbi:MAG: hypothetical protein AB1765_10015 [Candidatus Hydrogenedentota bacterium]
MNDRNIKRAGILFIVLLFIATILGYKKMNVLFTLLSLLILINIVFLIRELIKYIYEVFKR